jgi:SAM-dependent methyltransferase
MFRRCPYCGEDAFDMVYKGRSIPTDSIASTADFNLVSCKNCKTVYVNPAPNPETLISYYSPDYYSSAARAYPSLLKGLAKFYNFFSSVVMEWTAEPIQSSTGLAKRVLEVGCADGENLQPFIRAGWETYAIEPNARLANMAKAKGIRVHIGLPDSFDWETEKFDVVVLKHVLEHDYNPRYILERCVYALRPGGYMYVEVPVVQTFSWKMMGRYWGELEFPIHLSFFRKEQILDIITSMGCLPIKCRTSTLLGGPFRSLRKLHPFRNSTRSQKAVLLVLGVALQAGFLALNMIAGQGENFSVVARRTRLGPFA